MAEEVKEKIAGVQCQIQEQVNAYAEKGRHAFECVKGKATGAYNTLQEEGKQILENAHKAVDNTYKTAEPFVLSAKHTAENVMESSKDGVRVAKDKLQKGVDQVQQFDWTQTCIFRMIVQMVGFFIFVLWCTAQLFPFMSKLLKMGYSYAVSYDVLDAAMGLCHMASSAVKRIPVVGIGVNKAIVIFCTNVRQNVQQRIDQVYISRKAK